MPAPSLRRVACVAALATALLAAPAVAQAPATAPEQPTLVVGDSLGVGMTPYLGGLLPGRALLWAVKAGRGTAWGLGELRTQLRSARPAAVVASLGSNDGPDPKRFADRIRRVLAAVPATACVYWPSIVRPPRKGDETELNRTLRAMALRDPRLVIVDWEGAVLSGRVLLPDELHPDAAGYAERSRLVAEAIQRGCTHGVGGTLGPAED